MAQHGVEITRILPISATTQSRIWGQDKDAILITADFNAPLPETVLNDFLAPTFPTS